MLCPLIHNLCVTKACAWYDNGNQCCAILSLPIELIKNTDAILDSSGGRRETRLTVNPVVEVKEIIKTILPEVRHERTGPIPDQASEPLSTVTWFKSSQEGDKARVGTSDNAGTEPQDVGDNTEGNDSHWSANIPGQDFAIPTDVYGLGQSGASSGLHELGDEYRGSDGEDVCQL